MQPRNLLSPAVLSPAGGDAEVNPFESEFNGYDDEEDDYVHPATPPPEGREQETHKISAARTSPLPAEPPDHHHPASYAGAGGGGPAEKEKKHHRTKCPLGLRSRPPPMEVMLEI